MRDSTLTGFMEKRRILLTNDDGVSSPGLLAAAAALSQLGQVTIVAPQEQQTSSGRGMSIGYDGRLHRQQLSVDGSSVTAYSLKGTPAQSVRHGILDVLAERPHLVVSGINYGENPGTCVTISGTVGAAIEAAALGLPSLAVSLQTEAEQHFNHSPHVDFTAAGHFTRLGAEMLLAAGKIPDVDMLKIEVPAEATCATPWVITRVSRQYYYAPVRLQSLPAGQSAPLAYRIQYDPQTLEPDSDIHALRVRRFVSISPLSIDLTSRVDLQELEEHFRRNLPLAKGGT
jgi:5'-nucleotidase